MKDLTYLIALLISTGALVYVVVIFIKKTKTDQDRILFSELKKQRQEFFLPNRADAYQRAILFLERIHPNSLIMRMQQPALGSVAFQALLLKTIRDEYEHNVAQQMFISPKGWKMLKDAKEETIKLINVASGSLAADSNSMMLSAAILNLTNEVGVLPAEIAVEFLKEELQTLF